MLRQAAPLRSKNKGIDMACRNYERRIESALRFVYVRTYSPSNVL